MPDSGEAAIESGVNKQIDFEPKLMIKRCYAIKKKRQIEREK